MKPRKKTYKDNECPACGNDCAVVPLENEFSYTGYGGGVHYPFDWGIPVSKCCGVEILGAEEDDTFITPESF